MNEIKFAKTEGEVVNFGLFLYYKVNVGCERVY